MRAKHANVVDLSTIITIALKTDELSQGLKRTMRIG